MRDGSDGVRSVSGASRPEEDSAWAWRGTWGVRGCVLSGLCHVSVAGDCVVRDRQTDTLMR